MSESLVCNLISPERVLFSAKVEFITCPTENGEIGLLKDHTALVSTVGTGIVRINDGKKEIQFAVNLGFIEIRDNDVAILVTRAKTADEIDKSDLQNKIAELKKSNLGEPKNLLELAWLKAQVQLASLN